MFYVRNLNTCHRFPTQFHTHSMFAVVIVIKVRSHFQMIVVMNSFFPRRTFNVLFPRFWIEMIDTLMAFVVKFHAVAHVSKIQLITITPNSILITLETRRFYEHIQRNHIFWNSDKIHNNLTRTFPVNSSRFSSWYRLNMNDIFCELLLELFFSGRVFISIFQTTYYSSAMWINSTGILHCDWQPVPYEICT